MTDSRIWHFFGGDDGIVHETMGFHGPVSSMLCELSSPRPHFVFDELKRAPAPVTCLVCAAYKRDPSHD